MIWSIVGRWVISPQLTNTFLFLVEGFARRKKISLWFVGSLLLVSTLILTIGLAATTRTENVTVGGYYPGIIVSQRPMGDWAGCSVIYVDLIVCSARNFCWGKET